ncbi:molybdenum cofactor guanylyltransferase [Stieleria varia]|uniref:Molybdopterin-guanine dinucleotide biosynthesis protein MobA n=1 Tax=Stieleria varia TaxID=2528005 RepID=A0A5C6A082_9BACT|nr:molybdenum cofactor guanylyltransferase [Stieleria varia]TWT92701.1 molybdopterin-guanine dinucleotide biosynthesis protein MobA [Stieleria varia]
MNNSPAHQPTTRHTTGRLLGIVLSGGKSSRMGRNKATLRTDASRGLSFLQHAVGRLRDVCHQVCVSADPTSLPHEILAETCLQFADFIPDTITDAGPIAGVLSGLTEARRRGLEGILITPVDVPNLGVVQLNDLIAHWQADQRQVVCAVSSTDPDASASFCAEPLIAIYPLLAQAELQSFALAGGRSLNRWLSEQTIGQVPMPPTACRNINCPDDLRDG